MPQDVTQHAYRERAGAELEPVVIVGPGSNHARWQLRFGDGSVRDLPKQRLVCEWEDRVGFMEGERLQAVFDAHTDDMRDETAARAINAVTDALGLSAYSDYWRDGGRSMSAGDEELRQMCESTSVTFQEAVAEPAFRELLEPEGPRWIIPIDVATKIVAELAAQQPLRVGRALDADRDRTIRKAPWARDTAAAWFDETFGAVHDLARKWAGVTSPRLQGELQLKESVRHVDEVLIAVRRGALGEPHPDVGRALSDARDAVRDALDTFLRAYAAEDAR